MGRSFGPLFKSAMERAVEGEEDAPHPAVEFYLPSPTVELWLLRHADAGDPEAWFGPDAQRPLSRKGRKHADRLARFLKDIGRRPDMIVSSPKVRASQTAEIVADRLKMRAEIDERVGRGLDLETVEALIQDRDARRPMLVGHDPDMSEVIAALCGAATFQLEKGALAMVAAKRPLGAGSGGLRWLVPPELLKPGG